MTPTTLILIHVVLCAIPLAIATAGHLIAENTDPVSAWHVVGAGARVLFAFISVLMLAALIILITGLTIETHQG